MCAVQEDMVSIGYHVTTHIILRVADDTCWLMDNRLNDGNALCHLISCYCCYCSLAPCYKSGFCFTIKCLDTRDGTIL